MNLFEEAALRRAEAEAHEIRSAARADAYRRLNAVEAERREILTNATYRASVTLREAETFAAELRHEALIIREASVRNAMEERDRLRDDAMVQAKRIIEDATSEAAKLLTTMNMEREHILADARDDARQIVARAYETAAHARGPETEPAIAEPAETATDSTADADDRTEPVDVPEIIVDEEVPTDLETAVDNTTVSRHMPSDPPHRRRRRWYHP